MRFPRLLIAGSGGDSGKTLVTLGLIGAWRHRGKTVVPFKKGPDYIDPAWLALASDNEVHNLDTWMMGSERTLRSFTKYAKHDCINLIEGNRGLHDGEDAKGSHSSGVLARLLETPVVLVIPVTKVTRSVAAIVLGMKLLDKDVNLAGVVLNKIGGVRHESIIRRAVEDETGIPVVGAIPRIRKDPLPDRHLGLITPEEHSHAKDAISIASRLIADSVDIDTIEAIAESSPELKKLDNTASDTFLANGNCKIGYLTGSAFTFYYPENLCALRDAGATLIGIDPLEEKSLPELDALYIGGGFPETHARALAENREFLNCVRDAADNGLPVWAECGGLMFLANSLVWKDETCRMAGVLSVDIEMNRRPMGHGYMEVIVDRENPFLDVGTRIRGHEFHYSQVKKYQDMPTGFSVKRGTGLGGERDGLIYKNVLASYLHIHATASPVWAEALIEKAVEYKRLRQKTAE